MKSLLAAAILCLLSSLLSTTVIARQSADSMYLSIVGRVKAGDTTVDCQGLRFAYAATSQYDPFTVPPEEDSIQDALRQKKYRRVLELAEEILDRNYVYIPAHSACARAYRGMGDSIRSAFHEGIAERLLVSIANSGDGKSLGSGYKIIHVQEQYALLLSLGYWPTKHEEIESEIPYEIVTAEHESTGKEAKFYFDISIPIEWAMRKYDESEGSGLERR